MPGGDVVSATILRAQPFTGGSFGAFVGDPIYGLANVVKLYTLQVMGVMQMFAVLSDNTIVQITPVSGICARSFYACDDFTASTTSNATTAGTGSVVYTTVVASIPGIATQSVTSTVTPDSSRLFPATSVVTSMLVGGGFGITVFDSRCRTPTIQDATDAWVDRWGMGDTAAADQVDGIYFECDRVTNGDNLVRLCTSTASVRTKTSTAAEPTANVFQRWTWVLNAAGTSVSSYIDGVATGTTITTNIPTTGAMACWFGQLIKTLGILNARTVDRDYLEAYVLFTSPR